MIYDDVVWAGVIVYGIQSRGDNERWIDWIMIDEKYQKYGYEGHVKCLAM